MKVENSKFDKIVLAVVIIIGAVFIGISLLSVNKNSGYAQQAAVANLTTLKTKKPNVPVNGICGMASGKAFEHSPTVNLCSTGNPSVVIIEENNMGKFYTWQCAGINNGITASCNATANLSNTSTKINAECGSSDGQRVSSMPTLQEKYCKKGNYVKGDCTVPIYDSAKKEWASSCRWTCVGTNGGGEAKCSATLVK